VFELCSYLVGAQHQIALPVYIKPVIIFSEVFPLEPFFHLRSITKSVRSKCKVGGSKIDIEVGLKQSMGKTIEDLTVVVPMPKCVNSVSASPSAGTWSFDQVSVILRSLTEKKITKTLRWELKKATLERPVSLRGSVRRSAVCLTSRSLSLPARAFQIARQPSQYALIFLSRHLTPRLCSASRTLRRRGLRSAASISSRR
jgi:hypothetical protein